MNFGWVVGEVLRLVDGRPISQFLREEVTEPLGMKDFYLGLPPSEEHRVAKLYVTEKIETPEVVASLQRIPAAHQAVIPAGNGISTARDLARFYAMLGMAGTLDGVEVIRSWGYQERRSRSGGGEGRALRPIRQSWGWASQWTTRGWAHRRSSGRYNHSIGHSGFGSSIGWLDLDKRLAVAIITNGVRGEESNGERLTALSEAVRDACE